MFRKTMLSALALLAIGAAVAVAQSGLNGFRSGDQHFYIRGTAAVESGGVLNIESGGAFQIAGSDRTTPLSTAPGAVAAGYKIARGTGALDGSNPTDVATGLSTIVACTTNITTTVAPGVNTSVITYATNSATLSLYGWKPTNSSTTTMIASTEATTFAWICVGT